MDKEMQTLMACWLVLDQFRVYPDYVDQKSTQNQLRNIIRERLESEYGFELNKESLERIISEYLGKNRLKVVA